MISAKIVADSVNPNGDRLVTWLLVYPRFIHSEFMTHRQFSRNAASSRAIPLKKMMASIKECPAMPEQWGLNEKGMSSSQVAPDKTIAAAKENWRYAMEHAVAYAEDTSGRLNIHKQIANRLLEPFSHMTVLASATEHDNFFALRAHPAAQPEFQVLAYRMLDRYLHSRPTPTGWGNWHIPFGDQMPEGLSNDERLKVATARAARLSYLTFDGKIDVEADIALHDRLAASGHWSPFEHAAMASSQLEGYSNFKGWMQYRKTFSNENRTNVDLCALLAEKPSWISLENAE